MNIPLGSGVFLFVSHFRFLEEGLRWEREATIAPIFHKARILPGPYSGPSLTFSSEHTTLNLLCCNLLHPHAFDLK